MIKSNCKRCTERHENCHSECASYLTYAIECERIRQNRQQNAEYNGYIRRCNDKATRIHFGLASR